jgi:cell division protein FtsL
MAIEVHFQKRIINNMNLVREPDARNQREYLFVTLLGALFVLVLLFYGWQHYQWIQYGYLIEEAEKQKDQLTDTGKQLRLERASLRSMQRIDSIARGELGMVVPAAGQLVIFSADSPLTIPGPRPSQSNDGQLAAKR